MALPDTASASDAVAGVNVILDAALAVVANDDETALFAQLDVPVNVPVNEPLKLPVLICNELDTTPLGSMVGAYEALVATLLVPNNDPVIPVVTESEPDTTVDPVTYREPVISNPLGNVRYPVNDDAVSAVVAIDAVSEYDAVAIVPVITLAVAAYEAEVTLPSNVCATAE